MKRNFLYQTILFLFGILLLNACTSVHKLGRVPPQSAIAIPDSLYPAASLTIATHNDWTKKNYPQRIKVFRKEPLQMHDIVLLGNSITQLGHDWGARLHNPAVKNRGIAGDVTDGVLARLGEICYVQPTAVFIEIGINDLFNSSLTPERTAKNIVAIINNIHSKNPGTKIFFQTIFPTSHDSLVQRITQTNKLVLAACKPNKWFSIIDTHALFADKNDLMIKEYSKDGVHPNEKGYEIWVKCLQKYFDTSGIL